MRIRAFPKAPVIRVDEQCCPTRVGTSNFIQFIADKTLNSLACFVAVDRSTDLGPVSYKYILVWTQEHHLIVHIVARDGNGTFGSRQLFGEIVDLRPRRGGADFFAGLVGVFCEILLKKGGEFFGGLAVG
jgi:hypothetical protein